MEQGEGWEHGIGAVYEVMAEDFLYPDPQKLVTFLDNHDTHRWIAEAGSEDKARAGLAMLLMRNGAHLACTTGQSSDLTPVANPTERSVKTCPADGPKTTGRLLSRGADTR